MIKQALPHQLLVVEDNPGDYLLLKEFLQLSQLPFNRIFHSETMMEVPLLVKNNHFDVAMLDLTLPDSSGIDSVITLDRLLPKTPIVVFSGLSDIDLAVEAISLGAQDYLVKGEFDEKLLAKSIQYSIERKKTMQRLQESYERYAYVNKATNDTIWEWDYRTGKGLWGEGFIKTFGYAFDKKIYNSNWLQDYVHPDDRERITSKIKFHVEHRLENWQDEYRFRCEDGSYKHVFDRGFILFDKEGKPYRMIGAMTDLTERIKASKEIADYRYALDQSAIVSITDEHGIIKYVNDNFCSLFGYTKEEAIGQNHSIINSAYHTPDFWKHFWNTIKKGEVLKTEIRNRTKTGELFWGETTIVPFLDEQGKPYQYLAIRTDITEKRKLERELEEQKLQQQKIITEVTIQAQEKERDQLGKELHDNINQILASVKMYLGMAKKNISDEFVQRCYEYVNMAMEEIRKLSRTLVAPSLDGISLPLALKGLQEEINMTNTLQVNLQIEMNEEEQLDKNKELMLYRIVQEQLTNIQKHAKATAAFIRLRLTDNYLRLDITDDGQGFDISKRSQGIGLKNIKSRVEFHSGKMNLISSPGNGCTLEVTIPLAIEEE